MEILSSLFPFNRSLPLYPHYYYLVAAVATALCLLLTLRSSRLRRKASKSDPSVSLVSTRPSSCACPCTCPSKNAHLNGWTTAAAAAGMIERASVAVLERQTGASMMEQLVPEITTHALTYLDYPSLCRLSMTNSLMRKAANDDSAWKALYHKDFTVEQDSVTPVNGWKAYYAATRAIVNINSEFFDIIRERSTSSMRRLWLNADYVKCFHASGGLYSGYSAVIQSWQRAFNWGQGVDFQVRDVRVRVLPDMAWVTLKAFVDMDPFNMTNIFEFHNGRWYLVHHHSSVMASDGNIHG